MTTSYDDDTRPAPTDTVREYDEPNDLPAEVATEPPFAILPTPLGTVRVMANGVDGKNIRMSNYPEDRTDGRGATGEPNGVSDIVVRGIPHRVNFWVSVSYGEHGARIESDYDDRRPSNFKRLDKGFGLDSGTDAAVKKITEELQLALAKFLDTEEGKALYKAGRVHCLGNRMVSASRKVDEISSQLDEARDAEAAAVAAYRAEVAS